MSPETLIRSRRSLHLERLRRVTAKLNAGETHEGFTDLATAEAEESAVILELEHLTDALGITLDERLYG